MQAHPSQQFASSYAKQSPFTSKGLRSFWEYRDLGIEAATHGKWKAQVLRATKPSPPGGTGWHCHALDFQMYYILTGTMGTEVQGQGALRFGPGDSFMQPPGTWHNVVEFSAELTMLEVVSPAAMGTTDGDGPPPEAAPVGTEQRFTTQYVSKTPFVVGLRPYFEYRDLGMAAGSQGLVQAHVLRAVKACPPEGTGWHFHEVDFQMVYVLQGRITTELEGQGPCTFTKGDAWLQPPQIKHCVTGYSDDLMMIEIVSPADFSTVDVERKG